jgi:drug/metabolite transporter (DMT)-like permease
MKRYTPSVMMSFNFVSPVAGVILAAWLLDERVTPLLLAGMALVAAGLALITRRSTA